MLLIRTDDSEINRQNVLHALQGKTGADKSNRHGGNVWFSDIFLGICYYSNEEKKWKLRGIEAPDIEARLTELEKRLAQLQTQITDVQNLLLELQEFVSKMQGDIDNIRSGLDELQRKLDTLLAILDTDVQTDTEIQSSESTVNIAIEYTNLKTGQTNTVVYPLPVASTVEAGVLNAEDYKALLKAIADIAGLQGAGYVFANLGQTPTQAALTSAWEAAKGNAPIEGSHVINLDENNTQYMFANKDGVGIWLSQGNFALPIATQTVLGGIYSSLADGTGYVNGNGVLSVNGWDVLSGRVTTLESTVAGLQTALNGKSDTNHGHTLGGDVTGSIGATVVNRQRAIVIPSLGSNGSSLTTAQLLTHLHNNGFSSPINGTPVHYIGRCQFSYASFGAITDTGVGNIGLAGSYIEVFTESSNISAISGETTLRVFIHTAPTTANGNSMARASYVYVNNGSSYTPGWHRLSYNNGNNRQLIQGDGNLSPAGDAHELRAGNNSIINLLDNGGLILDNRALSVPWLIHGALTRVAPSGLTPNCNDHLVTSVHYTEWYSNTPFGRAWGTLFTSMERNTNRGFQIFKRDNTDRNIYYRSYAGSWGSWFNFADAATLGGWASDTANSANTIVRRTSDRYIYAQNLNMAASNDNGTDIHSLPYFNNDGFLRKTSRALPIGLGGTGVNNLANIGALGTWQNREPNTFTASAGGTIYNSRLRFNAALRLVIVQVDYQCNLTNSAASWLTLPSDTPVPNGILPYSTIISDSQSARNIYLEPGSRVIRVINQTPAGRWRGQIVWNY